jgi:hypothetical protein
MGILFIFYLKKILLECSFYVNGRARTITLTVYYDILNFILMDRISYSLIECYKEIEIDELYIL